MARRKIRPLGVLAVIAVFAFIQLLRKGSPEVFTFDSYSPYTDDGKYVKKPTPTPMPWSKPPPPPPEWVQQRQHQQNPQGKPIADDNSKSKPPTANKIPPKKLPPKHQQEQVLDTHERPAYADTASNAQEFAEHSQEIEHPFNNPRVVDLPQPPAPGHYNKHPQQNLPPYTPEELAPRVEKYPIPANEIIKLPKMKPKTLPRVQARFPAESAEQKRIRSQRQAAIKRAMTRSWEAYSTYAMGHDELRPVSGRVYDPFCGWGATLVDSLDTLQIMGMQAEYEEALMYVEKVDFAHTRSYSIPLFETVIRYLGGLLGAYDMSNGKDTMLLDKAKDLADMLMGAFDTVNRMPLLRYDWRPRSARQNLRASEDSCLAEMGTLTLEFTRLAQLTGNHTYFDAVTHFNVRVNVRCKGSRMDLKGSNSPMSLDYFRYISMPLVANTSQPQSLKHRLKLSMPPLPIRKMTIVKFILTSELHLLLMVIPIQKMRDILKIPDVQIWPMRCVSRLLTKLLCLQDRYILVHLNKCKLSQYASHSHLFHLSVLPW
jgi:mannosyl-oligosaccharide alpha-1,2-mannosidase